MASSKRIDSTPAGVNRHLFLRWNKLQVNVMEDPSFRVVPTVETVPKVTSQARLIWGAKNRVLNAQKELDEKSKTSEIQEKDVHTTVKRVMDAQSGKSNPLEYFKQHRFDEEVDLNGWHLGPVTSREIATEYFSSSTIVRLFLANNRLGNEGGKAVAKGLETNLSIRELDLSGNVLGQSAIFAIGEMLNKNETLQKLNLSRNDLTDQDVEFLLHSLCLKSGLKDLDLSHNILCDQFAEQMSVVLEKNVVLEKLSVSSNQLEVSGLQAMSPGLRNSATLRTLNISWNYLYDVGAEILGEVMAQNQSLIEISACGNLFTTQAASFLAKGVINNSNLKVLRIGQNLIRNSGAHEFLNVLSVSDAPSTVLEVLDINGTVVDKKFQKRVETELCERFPSLNVVNFSLVDNINTKLEPVEKKAQVKM